MNKFKCNNNKYMNMKTNGDEKMKNKYGITAYEYKGKKMKTPKVHWANNKKAMSKIAQSLRKSGYKVKTTMFK